MSKKKYSLARLLKKAHPPIALSVSKGALDRLASTYSVSTPPLVDFSRASWLNLFEQPGLWRAWERRYLTSRRGNC
jgi:hypothetical protein